MNAESIISWIESLDSHSFISTQAPYQARCILGKRVWQQTPEEQYVGVRGHTLPTPTSSVSHSPPDDHLQYKETPGFMSSPSKRRRADNNDPSSQESLNDLTPRPHRRLPPVSYEDDDSWEKASSNSRGSGVSGISSNASKTSSRTKQYRNAELQETGFRLGNLTANINSLPPSLKALRQKLVSIYNGESILPPQLKDELSESDIPNYAFYGPDTRGFHFFYPPSSVIHNTLRRAAECFFDNEGESSWNMDVHRPLLDWTLNSPDLRNTLSYRYCTSAQVVKDFKPHNAPSRMVDFCLAIHPADREQGVINALCRQRPYGTINHTDWGNLCKHPIAISIETKRPGEQLHAAMLQMGNWHSSQLRSLAFGRDAPLSSIEFVAGIIIQGHEWQFVASTPDGRKAVMFMSQRLGNTESEFGIYKLLASLQCLKEWAENDYWHAFKKDVLNIVGE